MFTLEEISLIKIAIESYKQNEPLSYDAHEKEWKDIYFTLSLMVMAEVNKI